MSNANRDYAIVYDVKNSSLVLSRPLNFYITDKNTSNIFVRLVTRVNIGNGVDQYTDIEEASSYVLTMRVIKPNNEVKSIEATQHEEGSIFQFDLTEDFKDIPGKYICELTISTIVSGRQELITSDSFNYEVKRSILSNVGEITETEDTTVEKLLNNLDATKSELSSQIKNIVNVGDLAKDRNNVYIKDSNGNKIGHGITISSNYYLNVNDYNSTETNDITTALELAIEATIDHGIIIVPPGSYVISNTITINKPVTIKGGGTIIKGNGMNNVMFNITSNHVTMCDLEINGNINNQSADSEAILVNGASYCTIKNMYIHDVAGNGILVLKGASNTLEGNIMDNIKMNALFVANKGADKNKIINNTVISTQQQNAIFLTASGDSTGSSDYIYDNIVQGNIVYSAADTAIETGIHTVSTIVSNNIVYATYNPGLLARDAENIVFSHNVVYSTEGTINDGITVVGQTEGADKRTNIIITDNQVIGAFPRAAIFISQSDVLIANNKMKLTGGSRGIALASVNYISILGNTIYGADCPYGVDLNYPTTSCTMTCLNMDNNYIEQVVKGISMYNMQLNACKINNNMIRNATAKALEYSFATGENVSIINNVFSECGDITVPSFQ